MLSSASRNVLRRGSQRTTAWISPSSCTVVPANVLACRSQPHRQLSTASLAPTEPPPGSSHLRVKPWAFTPDSTFKGNSSPAARCQFEAISHAKGKRRLIQCLRLVREMKIQGLPPDLVIYNSLLACIAEEGLPLEAWAVIDDMTAMGISPDRQSYHHLMHASRWSSSDAMWEIVDKMKSLGIEPNEQTYALIINRMTTTESIELALQFMDELTSRGLTPQLTTAQDIVRLAAELNFPRLAVELAQKFEEQSVRRIDGETWMACLISSAEALYAHGVERCWKKVVHGLSLNPDEGACIAILHTCARHGLADLAIDVTRVLRTMGVEWHEYHYAPLIEALCKADRLKEAFGTLDIMRSNSIIPTTETAQPITDFLKQDIDRVDRVWRILDELQKESKAVDTTAINAVIQACVALDDLQRAIGAYKAFADYGCKPNVDTFNSLLSGCVGAKHRDFGNKILLDLKQASVKPDARTYEHIIQLCLTEPTYEDAFFYLEEMKTQKFMPSAKAYEAIIRTCISARDSRYSLALSEMGHCGYTPSPSLQRFMAKSNSTDLPQTHNTL